MCSGERLSVAVKNGRAIQDVWTLPMVMSGNQAPSYVDDSGSIARRLAIVRFTVPLAAEQKDPQLFRQDRAGDARDPPEDGQGVQGARWTTGTPSATSGASRATPSPRAAPSSRPPPTPWRSSRRAGLLVFEPGSYMKLADLKLEVRAWCRARGSDRLPQITVDTLTDVFKPRGAHIEQKSKKLAADGVSKTVTAWVVGARMASSLERD